LKHGGNVTAATEVGKKLAEVAKGAGISKACFDRGPYRFHGRVAALARAATEAGLVCTGPDVPKPKAAPAEAAPVKAAKVKGEGKGKGEGKPKGDGKKGGEGFPKKDKK